MLAFSNDYYGLNFRAKQSVELFCAYRKMMGIDSCGMIISATHLVEGREGLNVLILDDQIPAGAKLY